MSYKRILTERDTAPNFNIVDLSNPFDPQFHYKFWDIEDYLEIDSLAYQGTINNVMAKISPVAKEG